MARARMLSTTIATDRRLNDLSMEAEYLFYKILPHLDRDGLILADGPVLWGTVCPRKVELLPRIDALLAEIEEAGIVVCYETAEGRVAWFPRFSRHQAGMRYDREAPSALEPPPGYIRTETGLARSDAAGADPEQIQQPAGATPGDSGVSPEFVRSSSGVCRAEDQDQVKDQDQDQAQECVSVTHDAPPPAREWAPNLETLPFPEPKPDPSRNGRRKHHGIVVSADFDPRKLAADGLIPEGKGSTPLEVWREFSTEHATAAQARELREVAGLIDLDEWRAHVRQYAKVKGWKSLGNVMDVWDNGERGKP